MGAHAGGFNKDTFGVSMLGNYSTVAPSPAMKQAVTDLITWKLSLHGVDPRGQASLTSAGGGTAIGGLAGTNIGEGDPDDGDLEEAMGSGNYDQALDDDHEDTTAYSGPAGGAVGGAVADLRATGGKADHGIAPQPDPGDSPVGQ